MGYLPKYRQNAQRVHRIFKDELLKCEMYSREAKLLSENNIVSEQDLYGFERTIQKKMTSLEQKREELRKEVKRTISDEQKEKKRERIRELTMELREIRSQLKLCEDIKERSSVIEEKLAVIDKEKEQGRKVRV